jgi:hypothetical protein
VSKHETSRIAKHYEIIRLSVKRSACCFHTTAGSMPQTGDALHVTPARLAGSGANAMR